MNSEPDVSIKKYIFQLIIIKIKQHKCHNKNNKKCVPTKVMNHMIIYLNF